MTDIFALVDCNNFYASCERLFIPALEGQPVIVLSNNDGCVIARSQEAKTLGVGMGVPAFEIGDLLRREKVKVFSTNYALYGDMSERVMTVAIGMAPEIEVYSIDEAFLDITHLRDRDLHAEGTKIRDRIVRHTGIPVSIGIGPTKTLAKAANYLAKRHPDGNGVMALSGTAAMDGMLERVPVVEVWGVGSGYNAKFKQMGIHTALDLKRADENRMREWLGVMGQRLVLELRGQVCYPLNQNPEQKREVCTSRSFGHPLTSYGDLEEATMTYAGKVARKLRRQGSLAGTLSVFVMTNKYAKGPQYVNFKVIELPEAGNDTQYLIHYARIALRSLFRKGYLYKKSGVIASGLVPAGGRQGTLWTSGRRMDENLVKAMDRINARSGPDRISFAIQGNGGTWKMRQHSLSPHYTTRWEDIPLVNVDRVIADCL